LRSEFIDHFHLRRTRTTIAKNIAVDLPREHLIIVTVLSGSGNVAGEITFHAPCSLLHFDVR